MLSRRDWVVPTFNGELRGHKPALLYWLIMSAYWMFGKTEFAARFWSAMLSVGSCVLTADLIRRHTAGWAPLLSGAMLATSLMFGVAARAATPDAALIFCVTAALWWFGIHLRNPQTAPGRQPTSEETTRSGDAQEKGVWPPARLFFGGCWWRAVAFYVLLGLAVLAKGPVGFVLPTAIVAAYLLSKNLESHSSTRFAEHRSSWRFPVLLLWRVWNTLWQLRPLSGLLIVFAVAGPWYALVGWRTDGAFLYQFFVEHNLNRARTAMEGHSGPWWYYVPALLVGFFPWSVFFVPTAWQTYLMMRSKSEERNLALFLITWVVVWIAAFSLAQTKLPSYITPCYPAMAGLTAIYVDRTLRSETSISRNWLTCALCVLVFVGVLLTTGLVLAGTIYFPDELILSVVGIIPVVTGILALVAWKYSRPFVTMQSLLVGSVAMSLVLFAWAAPRVDAYRQFGNLLDVVNSYGQDSELAAVDVLEPSWVFYHGRPIRYFSNREFTQPDKVYPQQQEVLEFLQGGARRFVIVPGKTWQAWRSSCPDDIRVLNSVRGIFEKEELVLLGSVTSDITHAARNSPTTHK
jgi:4-amino-4-deoxy-L-arabinose transferase-like glycosyltransferase